MTRLSRSSLNQSPSQTAVGCDAMACTRSADSVLPEARSLSSSIEAWVFASWYRPPGNTAGPDGSSADAASGLPQTAPMSAAAIASGAILLLKCTVPPMSRQ